MARTSLFALLAALMGWAISARAATFPVESIDELVAKIQAATPGDTIVLKNGTYNSSGRILIACRGTPDRWITITAEHPGQVELAGATGFNVIEPAAFVLIAGFKFTGNAGQNSAAEGTDHIRFTQNFFFCTGDGPDLSVAADDAEIDYNEFGNKSTPGSFLAIAGSGGQIARRTWIHHNFFHDYGKTGGTGTEMVRFGLSATGPSNGAGRIEHNLFLRCRGQNDLVSSRSTGNRFRYNTFLDSPNSALTLRHGNDCIVEGNLFRNTGGLRIYGSRHQVFSNYFEGNYIGINLGNGDTDATNDLSPSSHVRPDHCVIVFNTFVGNRTHYQMSRRSPGGLGARDITFANNLLQGADVAVKIEGPYTAPSWNQNLLWKNRATGDLPAGTFTEGDPLLIAEPDGLQWLQPGSPALGKAGGSFPLVTLDLAGQPRPEAKAIGAEEVRVGPAVPLILTVDEVGPGAQKTTAPPAVP